ncbi:hypothetical protein [Sphingomonas sp. Ant20]|uniref:hypothetical protein n=1 Tax=Sphingomonas sp. Ant20 TaxID=104605 RepID=UPI000536F86A|nr:hypothetical protein [Sphingomonas sp. Ant20]KHA65327.1 hypothetical protein NI18_03375 [Sphingomonas sp. Ant20]
MGRALRAAQAIAGQLEFRVARAACFGLPHLHLFPQRLVDDPQARLVAGDPLGFRVEARLPAEAALFVGYLYPGAPVEDPPANIQLIIQDALAKGRITRQGRRVPDAGIVPAALTRARRRYALRIEDGANLLEAVAGGIELEDAPDEVSLLLVDRQPVALTTLRIVADDLAPIAQHASAGSAAAHRLAFQPPPGRVGDAHALLLANDALERHHEIVDPAGDYRVHRHPVQTKQLHHVHEMLGVAAQPVDILDDEDADPAAGDLCQHIAQTGPFHRCAGDAVITVKGDQFQLVAFSIAFGEHALVGDRGGTVVRIVEAFAAIGNGGLGHR